eukprot:TRINITY_DN6780_c0_g2_i2.p1 TRINITY_DN6780_c0_g2~~TRINITY_DN6780_c0_g2_i2.p1  ORF type:complete len:233 (+),score=94.28 TRINITY_DN6780_c0_g2_i2:82-699(+)
MWLYSDVPNGSALAAEEKKEDAPSTQLTLGGTQHYKEFLEKLSSEDCAPPPEEAKEEPPQEAPEARAKKEEEEKAAQAKAEEEEKARSVPPAPERKQTFAEEATCHLFNVERNEWEWKGKGTMAVLGPEPGCIELSAKDGKTVLRMEIESCTALKVHTSSKKVYVCTGRSMEGTSETLCIKFTGEDKAAHFTEQFEAAGGKPTER